MGNFCRYGGGRRKTAQIVGGILMATGLILLLLSIPSWLWVSALGVLLISVGYLIWRFS